MKIAELEKLPFNMAVSRLIDEGGNNITTLALLKEFICYNVQNDSLYLAAHILDAIRESDAEYWDYDYNMGTLETPTPINGHSDLEDYCDFPVDQTYYVNAHINSLHGDMAEVKILEERRQENNTMLYIAEYEGKKCTAIFNPFVGQYYVDDIYGVLKED